MAEKTEYTKEEVLQITIDVLNRIRVPAAMIEEIGHPILGAVANLEVVLQMIEAEKKAGAARAAEWAGEADDGRADDAE